MFVFLAQGRTAFSGPGARFSKVPKHYGPFSGVTIPFVSQERTGFKSSNFAVILFFVTLKTCQKIGVPKQAVASFTNGFSGLSRNGPLLALSLAIRAIR